MNKNERIAKSIKIEKIIRKQMGESFIWNKPEIVETIGPYFPSAFDDYTDFHKAVKQRLSEHLNRLSIDDLIDRFDGNGNPLENPHGDFRQAFSGDMRVLRNTKPIWFSGGAGHPNFLLDEDYWSKMPFFNLDELLLCSVGVDPRKAKVKEMIDLCKTTDDNAWDVINFIVDRSRQFSRQFNRHNYSDVRVAPQQFLDFVDLVNLSGAVSFLDALRKIHQPQKQKQEIDPREKTALLAVIAIMAKESYNYVPVGRSDVPSELFEAAERNGIEISKETIRKHLKAAVGPIEEEWKHD